MLNLKNFIILFLLNINLHSSCMNIDSKTPCEFEFINFTGHNIYILFTQAKNVNNPIGFSYLLKNKNSIKIISKVSQETILEDIVEAFAQYEIYNKLRILKNLYNSIYLPEIEIKAKSLAIQQNQIKPKKIVVELFQGPDILFGWVSNPFIHFKYRFIDSE